ncbi:molybdenum ABC transporter ATP-binding protein [Azospirillum doebereinerae]|uniref:molybdenum ABC transporter ATP-binding protein n=1 Tax=Azospirillum doebereinerae TaxID=92933 RepID=UPI001EE62FCB|nr:molybdenum ABC transporter ATP-binding protein [Azospirillum doebereinerae]MCG5241760.1 molybdenum ABC transporter ATP-binding protein [Azospirillum doebereinerae]
MLDVSIRQSLGRFQLDIAFTAEERGVTALFGRSGSGKTSVINAIAGLTRPDSGHIRIGGTTYFDSAARVDVAVEKRRVGYVFQDSRLFPHMTVRSNLEFGLRRVPAAERRIALGPVVDLLGLGHLLDRRPRGLSGGEKQRVALGRALLAQPRLLLMDEPMASLDAGRKAEILPYIERLRDEMNIPIVLVSHALDEVIRLATTMVLIGEGRVVASGSVGAVMGRLDLSAVTGIHDTGAVLDLTVERHVEEDALSVLAFDGGRLMVPRVGRPVGAPVRLQIHARDVVLALEPPTNTSLRNTLSGRVTEIAESGPSSVDLRIAVGGSVLIARVTRAAARDLDLAPGRAVVALVKGVAFEPDMMGAGPARVVDV